MFMVQKSGSSPGDKGGVTRYLQTPKSNVDSRNCHMYPYVLLWVISCSGDFLGVYPRHPLPPPEVRKPPGRMAGCLGMSPEQIVTNGGIRCKRPETMVLTWVK